jgi:hypothetical protein
MNRSLRRLLPCLLAGSSLFLLSGCGELEDRGGGREYHRHAHGAFYREGRTYEEYPRDRYDRHVRYEDNSRVVVVNRRPSPYAARGDAYRSRTYGSVAAASPYAARTHTGTGYHQGPRTPPPAASRAGSRSSTNVVVKVSTESKQGSAKRKGKEKKD